MINGKRVRFRAIETLDLLRFVEWLNDSEVMFAVGRSLPLEIHEEEQWFPELQKWDPIEKPFSSDALKDTTWTHIGSCGLFGFEHQAQCARLGIMKENKNCCNLGHGTETMQLLIEHAFLPLNRQRVDLEVFEHN